MSSDNNRLVREPTNTLNDGRSEWRALRRSFTGFYVALSDGIRQTVFYGELIVMTLYGGYSGYCGKAGVKSVNLDLNRDPAVLHPKQKLQTTGQKKQKGTKEG